MRTVIEKEVDQEENIWRSLPFFAATLALQLAALFQLCVLAASIYPTKFRYTAKDSELLAYARRLIEHERKSAHLEEDGVSALLTLKMDLATQYALATDHNRQINKARDKRRSIASLLTILRCCRRGR